MSLPPEPRPVSLINRPLILILLLAGITVNYIDRGTLSVAADQIRLEFGLSETQLGFLLSAFFWSYSLFQIVAGWLVDRHDVKWIFAAGFAVWSAATACTSLVGSFAALFMARLLLGLGESVTYPACAKILARHFREEQRGFANGLVDGGSKIGPALSTLLGGLVVGHFGWRALFCVMGMAGVLWLWPWIRWMPAERSPAELSAERAERIPGMLEIVRQVELWGTALGMFALGYVWYFLLTWLPSYLIRERGYNMDQMAVLGSLPFWGMAFTSVAGGWLSDCWIRSGATPNKVRKTFLMGGLLLCAIFLFQAGVAGGARWSLAYLILASLSLGIFTSNVWAVTQTLAGPRAAGKWAAIQNAVGNLGGVVSPALTGWIVQRTGFFLDAFAGASVILLLGMISYATLVGTIKPVDWERGDHLPVFFFRKCG